jgi:hypothetical protein
MPAKRRALVAKQAAAFDIVKTIGLALRLIPSFREDQPDRRREHLFGRLAPGSRRRGNSGGPRIDDRHAQISKMANVAGRKRGVPRERDSGNLGVT